MVEGKGRGLGRLCKVLGIKNGVRERGGEDKSGNGLENKME